MKAVMYHYVRDFDKGYPQLHFLHIDDFSKQLDYFERKYGFVKKNDVLNWVRTGKDLPKGIVLTFDDGLKDHYSNVFPKLIEKNLWGIFYIPTSVLVSKRILGTQKIQFMLAKYGGNKVLKSLWDIISDEDLISEFKENHDRSIYINRSDDIDSLLVRKILNYYLDQSIKDDITDELFSYFFQDEEQLFKSIYLNKREMVEMNDRGMIIGSHSISHHPLTNLTHAQQVIEVEESLRDINSHIKELEIKTFSHPFGLPSTHDQNIYEILKSQNVDFSFAVESRDIVTNDIIKNKYCLPRFDCNEFKFGSSFISQLKESKN